MFFNDATFFTTMISWNSADFGAIIPQSFQIQVELEYQISASAAKAVANQVKVKKGAQ